MSDTDTSFKIPQAAAYACCSVDTIRDRIRTGHLKASRSGPYKNSHIVIRKADLDAMLRPVPSAVGDAGSPPDGLPVTLAALESRIARLESLLESGVA